MPQTTHRLTDQTWLTDMAKLAIAMTLFYFLWLGSYPLFTPDEGRYSEVAREMLASGDFVTPRVNGVAFLDKPVLYYWLQAAAMSVFGVNEWAIRFFPALFGIIGCLVTYFTGRQLFDRRTGLLSAMILATTPLYFSCAHYADLNLEVAVLISCSLMFFISSFKHTDKWRLYLLFGAYFCGTLAFLTKGLIGIAFPAIIIGCWMLVLSRLDLLKKVYLGYGILLFFVIGLPWYYLVQRANPAFLHYFFVTQQVTRFLSAGNFNNKTPFWFYLPIVVIGFFPWSIFLIQALYQQIKNVVQSRIRYSQELFLLIWATVVFVFFSIPHSKTIGYILPVFPPLALLTGRYLSTIWETATEQTNRVTAISLVIMTALLTLTLLLAFFLNWLPALPAFKLYLVMIIVILSVSAIAVTLCLIKKETLTTLFMICLATNGLFLLTLTRGATHLNENSAWPLLSDLTSYIQPQDEVITYYNFYEDAPIYLKRRITIVADWHSPEIANRDNWQRELWFGMPFQKTDDWLINEEAFWTRWNSQKRVFVLMNENSFTQFKTHAEYYFVLGSYNHTLLLSNQLTRAL